MTENKRLNYISFLQFLGPILVIIGHAMNGLEYNRILNPIKDWIYIFHMPLFFFIAGYLFIYTDSVKKKGYKKFIKEKFWRLLFPYLVLNIVFIIPKFAASTFIKDQVEFSVEYFIYIFLAPRANIWGHLWFLFALFLVYAISPMFKLIKEKNSKVLWGILIIFSIIIFIIRPIHSDWFALNDLQKDFLYFVLGMIIAYIPIEKIKSVKSSKLKFISILIVDVVLSILWGNNKDNTILQLVIGVITIMLLYIFPIIFNINNKFMERQASYSFAIYIMHWPAILVTRIVCYQILEINSLISFGLMLIAGYMIPNLIIYMVNKIKKKYNIKSKIVYYLVGI